MTKVSVIIPVYNTEKYLKECLDSIINQTLTDIEIICIDDGSKDNSLQILNKYAKKDTRIKVIEQKNKGAGRARNKGIKLTQGEFIAFMDADDKYPNTETLNLLYTKATENNVLICGGEFSTFTDDNATLQTNFIETDDGFIFKKEGIIEYTDYQFDYGYYRFIYNREFLLKNNLFFPKYQRFEDPPFFVKAMIMAKKFYAVKKISYAFRINHKNIIWNKKNANGVLQGIRDNMKLAKKYNLNKLNNYSLKRLKQHYVGFENITNLKSYLIIKECKKYNSEINRFMLNNNLIIYKKFYNSYMQNIFSIKNNNEHTHKIITILGIKINIKKRNKDAKFSIIIPTLQKNTNILNNLITTIDKDENIGEIILIDNSLKGYKHQSEKLKVIQPKQNLYVNPSWNLGIQYAKYKYIGILNDDILLPNNFCIQVLNFIKSNKKCGLIGIESSTAIENTKENFDILPEEGTLNFKELKHIYDNENYFWGSAIWGKKNCFYKIPSKLKIYSGDDYLLMKNNRAKRINYAISNVKIKHFGSLSSSSSEYTLIKENDQKYMAKLCPHYRKFYNTISKKKETSLLEKIFSVRNEGYDDIKYHKVITFLGLKIKIKKYIKTKTSKLSR